MTPLTAKYFIIASFVKHKLFYNEKHETTRKNFMEVALALEIRYSSHKIFSGR